MVPIWCTITLVLGSPVSKNDSLDFQVDGCMYVLFSLKCRSILSRYVVEIPPTTPLTTPPLPTLAQAPSSTTSAPAPTTTSGPGSRFSDGSGRKKYKVRCAIAAILTIAFIAVVLWGTYEYIRRKKAAAAARRQKEIALGRTSSTPSLARDLRMGSEPPISTISHPPSTSATLSSNRGPSQPEGPVPSTLASPDTTLELSVPSQQPEETSPMITDRTTGHG